MINQPLDELPGDHYEQAGANELALLGACIVNPAMLDAVAELVTAQSFANPDMGAAISLMIDLKAIGKPISDPQILRNELKRASLYDKIGGARFIGKAVNQSLPHNAVWYAREVAKLSQLRKLHLSLVRGAYGCTQPGADAAAIAQQTEAQIAAAQYDSAAELLELEPMLAAELLEIREAMKRGQRLGLPTGLPTLDETTGGFFNGELTVLAARPSIGKTAFAIELASRLAMRGRRVLFVSLEMTKKQLAHRFFNRETGIEVRRIQSADLTQAEVARLDKVRCELNGMKLSTWIPKGPGGATIANIRARARVQAAQDGLDLLVIDYLGLINHSGRLSAYERITAISKDVKSLAIELDRPILLLAQLNREAGKSGVEPALEHLRDSGAIEQDADNVWLLHRENRDAAETKLIIGKQRQGKADCAIGLEYDKAHMGFNESTGTLWKP